jgi:hypothetical protein
MTDLREVRVVETYPLLFFVALAENERVGQRRAVQDQWAQHSRATKNELGLRSRSDTRKRIVSKPTSSFASWDWWYGNPWSCGWPNGARAEPHRRRLRTERGAVCPQPSGAEPPQAVSAPARVRAAARRGPLLAQLASRSRRAAARTRIGQLPPQSTGGVFPVAVDGRVTAYRQGSINCACG